MSSLLEALPQFQICFLITLLHFVWQASLVGLIVWILQAVGVKTATTRYTLVACGLFCLPMLMLTTFVLVQGQLSGWDEHSNNVVASISTDENVGAIEGQARAELAANRPTGTDDDWAPSSPRAELSELSIGRRLLIVTAPVASCCYAIGATFFFVRLLVGVRRGSRLRTIANPVEDPRFLRILSEQSRLLGLRAAPALAYCDAVAVPTVIGVLRPFILLPGSIVAGLGVDELRIVLTHELAHVRRYDLVINLVQRFIESMLFFHPVVWYLSRQLSVERENCCDDLVVAYGCDRYRYAGTLLKMAELSTSARGIAPNASLAADGSSRSELEKRIWRLIAPTVRPRVHLTRRGVAVAAVVLSTAVVVAAAAIQPQVPGNEQVQPEPERGAAPNPSSEPESERATETAARSRDAKVEQAIARGIEYLLSKQTTDGAFGKQQQVAITALSAGVLIDAGVRLDESDRGKALRNALKFVANSSKVNGMMGREFYSHAYALRCLAKAKLYTKREVADREIQLGINLLVACQNKHPQLSDPSPAGGWRYVPTSKDMDVSITACATLALLEAKQAGFDVPQQTIEQATNYLKQMQRRDGGFYYSSPIGADSSVPRAAAAMCVLLRTKTLDEKHRQLSLDYLRSTPPDHHYYYALYYLAEALRDDRPSVDKWYRETKKELLASQKQDGHWDSPTGGEYATAKACSALMKCEAATRPKD